MLAEGFDQLADHLQSLYRNLEAKVAEKTSELHEKRERLEALYDMTTLIAGATSLETLASGFTERIRRVARADGVALRWTDEHNERYMLLASHGLPGTMTGEERCLVVGDCHCGVPDAPAGLRIIPIHSLPAGSMAHCAKAGFETVVSLPIRLHARTMGEVDLFYDGRVDPSESERSLLEALTAHLSAAMENLRLDSLAKEAAVSQERNLLARELHDSIAQSLAFLKIQVELMRNALREGDAARIQSVLDEIDVGVRESYADVRELLVHFRTRANSEQIEPALQDSETVLQDSETWFPDGDHDSGRLCAQNKYNTMYYKSSGAYGIREVGGRQIFQVQARGAPQSVVQQIAVRVVEEFSEGISEDDVMYMWIS